MKKLVLSILVIATGYWAQSQVVVEGVSPAAIQGNYAFTTQANCGAWPGETDDGSWNVLSNIDFNVPGAHIQGEIELVNDGSSGTNPQGNPISAEGCGALTNNLAGKIAVIYRNTCAFSDKVLNAQNAGAIGAIIVNREDALVGMLADVTGTSVTIPAVFLSSIDGQALIDEIANGPVTVFIGNKLGVNANDLSSYSSDALVSPYRTTTNMINNGFNLGIQLYNFGSNAQTPTVQATIDGPAGNVYDETVVGPLLNTGDTLSIFNGNPVEFPRFDLGLGNYPNGDYTVTYTITGTNTDDAPYDNVVTSTFTVTDDYLSLATNNGSGQPEAMTYPVGAVKPADYQSCFFVEDSLATGTAVTGLSFVPYADTSVAAFEGAEIFINAYEWNDGWTDLNDAAWFGAGATFNPFGTVESSLIDFVTHYPASDNETGLPVTVNFSAPILLMSGQRYLFCVQSFDTNVVFGYDNSIDYDANEAIYAMPVSPVKAVNTSGAPTWFAGGWASLSAPSITLHMGHAGLSETNMVEGMAYPNPATEKVTISVKTTGKATLSVTDISGKIVKSTPLDLTTGNAEVGISELESGVYIFNVLFEDGASSQFNVIKR